METTNLKSFLQLQCATLVLILCSLPEFSLFNMLTGVETDMAVILSTLVGVVIIGLGVLMHKDRITQPYWLIMAICAVIKLLALIPNCIPNWVEYVALLGFIVAFFMAKNALQVCWSTSSSEGAYFILLALLMHVFSQVNETVLTNCMAIWGLILYLIGLNKLSMQLDIIGKSGVSQLKIAVILGLVGIVLGLIPLVGGIIGGVFALLAFQLEFMGYGKFSKSTSMGFKGQQGGNTLRTSMIIMIVAAIIGFLSDSFAGIIYLVALFFVYSGWVNITCGLEEKQSLSSDNAFL